MPVPALLISRFGIGRSERFLMFALVVGLVVFLLSKRER